MRTLTENEYIWAVNCVSQDDRTINTIAWFTQRREAEHFCDLNPGPRWSIVQTTLWEGNGKWYALEMREVFVDMEVHKRTAIAKLTEAEKAALGLE